LRASLIGNKKEHSPFWSRCFVPNRVLAYLIATSLAAGTTGLTLHLHQLAEGSQHQAEHCLVCKDLTTNSKAVSSTPLVFSFELRPVGATTAAAQQFTLAPPSACVCARAPPAA
jgi:hypothetical protein